MILKQIASEVSKKKTVFPGINLETVIKTNRGNTDFKILLPLSVVQPL